MPALPGGCLEVPRPPPEPRQRRGGHTGRRAGAVGPSEPVEAVTGRQHPWRGSPSVLPRRAARARAARRSQWKPSPAGSTPGGIRQLSFHGSGGSLFGIHIVNVLLTLITLGIYYFWGKVRVRSYLLSQSEFEGDRFSYHGTGKELLIGWLKAMLVFGVPVGLLVNAPELLDAGVTVRIVAGVLVYCIVTV